MANARTLLLALPAVAACLAAGCFDSNGEKTVGDSQSRLQYVVGKPWTIRKSATKSQNIPHTTSGTLAACDIDTCAEPAQIAIKTGPVGDLLDDERYVEYGSLDNQKAFKRIFERMEGIPFPDDFQRIQLGELYGFRITTTTPGPGGRRYPSAGDYFIRGRDLITISAVLLTPNRNRDVDDVLKVLDGMRAGLRVGGKPVEIR